MKDKKILRRVILVAIVIVVILIAALIPKKKSQIVDSAGVEETVHSVRTQVIERQDLQEYLTMNGNVQSNNTISVYPENAGRILRVFVTLGSTVRRGDQIALIDPSSPGSYYAASPVIAPISGTITSLPLTVGTSVTTSTAVAQIGDITELQIKANVPERDIAVLKIDLKADVTFVAYGNEVFKAHVIRVSPIVDETSRSKEIYLAFDTEDSRINAGMYPKVKLYTTVHPDAIVIPYDSVSTQDDKSYVYIVNEDETVSARNVAIGVNVDGNAEILEGLSEGEKIVVSGIQSLQDGSKIKEVN